MKKNLFRLTAITLASFLLFSCSSDDDNTTPKPPTKEPEGLDRPYSKLEPTEQKAKLSKDGQTVVTKVEDLPEEPSVKLLGSFENKSSSFLDLLSIAQEDRYITRSFLRTDSANLNPTNDSVTKLSSYYGEYEWVNSENDWKKNKNNSEKLVAIFPESKNSTTNNGKIEVTAKSSGININNNEVPSDVIADLFVNNKNEGNVTIKATGIDKSKIVETANVIATLGTNYKFVANATKKGSENKSKFSLTKGNDTIISGIADLAAEVTIEKIENEDITNINEGNITLKVSDDLTAKGKFDGKILPELKEISQSIDSLYYNYYSYSEIAPKEQELEEKKVKLINDNMDLALVSSKDNNFKIAKITLKLEVESNDYYSEYTYKYILTFNDNTSAEAEAYFGEGFDDLINMWTDFINKFN